MPNPTSMSKLNYVEQMKKYTCILVVLTHVEHAVGTPSERSENLMDVTKTMYRSWRCWRRIPVILVQPFKNTLKVAVMVSSGWSGVGPTMRRANGS